MGSPKIRNYKSGSVIYFEGDVGSEIYVLQSGRIVLTSVDIGTNEDLKEDVQRGQFFGVKSALGRYPREDTAQVLSDSSVLVFQVDDFEQLSLRNPRIVLQMLKVFSGQLRRVHRKVREFLGEDAALDHTVELLKVAEYYYRNGQNDHALHSFESYINNYPNGSFLDRAKSMALMIKKGDPYPKNMASISDEFENTHSSEAESIHSNSEELLQENTGMGSLEPPPLDGGDEGESVSTHYYEGMNLYSHEDYEGAVKAFQQVFEIKSMKGEADRKIVEKANFDLGRALFKAGKNKEAESQLTQFIKKYPNSESYKKAFIQIAQVYIAKNDKARAQAVLQKVVAMKPADSDNKKAKDLLNKLK